MSKSSQSVKLTLQGGTTIGLGVGVGGLVLFVAVGVVVGGATVVVGGYVVVGASVVVGAYVIVGACVVVGA